MFQVDLLKSVAPFLNMQFCSSSFQSNCGYQLHLQKVSVPLQCLQTAKSLISSCRRIGETILQQLLAKPSDNCCCSLFSEAVTGLLLFYKETPNRCFPVKFAKCLRIPILKNICERLFLYLHYNSSSFSLLSLSLPSETVVRRCTTKQVVFAIGFKEV